MIIAIVEAELELIPKAIRRHREVIAYARRRGKSSSKLVLDSSFVPHAVKELPEGYRRGRPDILHRCLLIALDSIANKLGLIEKLYFHTRHNLWFEVNTSTRLPRNYLRFLGLMEQLLEIGRVPPEGEALIKKVDGPELKEPRIVLHENGESWEADKFKGFNGTLIVGAFPHGDFKQEWGKRVSIFDQSLTASSALYHALAWIVL